MKNITKNGYSKDVSPIIDLTDNQITILGVKNEFIYNGFDFGLNGEYYSYRTGEKVDKDNIDYRSLYINNGTIGIYIGPNICVKENVDKQFVDSFGRDCIGLFNTFKTEGNISLNKTFFGNKPESGFISNTLNYKEGNFSTIDYIMNNNIVFDGALYDCGSDEISTSYVRFEPPATWAQTLYYLFTNVIYDISSLIKNRKQSQDENDICNDVKKIINQDSFRFGVIPDNKKCIMFDLYPSNK